MVRRETPNPSSSWILSSESEEKTPTECLFFFWNFVQVFFLVDFSFRVCVKTSDAEYEMCFYHRIHILITSTSIYSSLLESFLIITHKVHRRRSQKWHFFVLFSLNLFAKKGRGAHMAQKYTIKYLLALLKLSIIAQNVTDNELQYQPHNTAHGAHQFRQ